MIAWPTLGAALAFLVHPHFPRNLRFWVVQNVQFFSGIDNLDVGNEIYAGGLHQIVVLEIGWWLGLIVLALATTERSESAEAPPEARDRFAAAGIAALAFGVLFVLMGRFGIYFVPTATLTLFAGIGVLGRVGRPLRLLPPRAASVTSRPRPGGSEPVRHRGTCLSISYPMASALEGK